MPDYLTSLLLDYRDSVWLGFLGFLGAVVRLALGLESGTKLTTGSVIATLISGVVFASVGSSFISGLAALPAGTTGVAGFICGLVGVAAAEMFVKKTFSLGSKKEKPQ